MQQNDQLKINLKWSELDFSKGYLVNLKHLVIASLIVFLMMKVCWGNLNVIPYTGMYLPYDLASEVTKSNDFLQACMYRNRYGIFLLGCTGLEDCKVYLSAFKLSTLYSWKLLTIFISFQLNPQKLLLASLQPDFLCLELCNYIILLWSPHCNI